MDKQAIAQFRKSLGMKNSSIQYISGRLADGDGKTLKAFGKMFGSMNDATKAAYSRIFQKVFPEAAVHRYKEVFFDENRKEEQGRLIQLAGGPHDEEEHQKLMDDIAKNVYAKLMHEPHLILLADGYYHIPQKEDAAPGDPDGYDYYFLIGAVCRVQEAKRTLCYDEASGMFLVRDQAPMEAGSPLAGFLFPSIESGKPDPDHALCVSGAPFLEPEDLIRKGENVWHRCLLSQNI